MTTTSVVLAIDFVDLIRAARQWWSDEPTTDKQQKETAELSRRFCKYLSAVLFFVIGSLLGGLSFRGIDWYSMLVPIGMLVGFVPVIVLFPSVLDRSRG